MLKKKSSAGSESREGSESSEGVSLVRAVSPGRAVSPARAGLYIYIPSVLCNAIGSTALVWQRKPGLQSAPVTPSALLCGPTN